MKVPIILGSMKRGTGDVQNTQSLNYPDKPVALASKIYKWTWIVFVMLSMWSLLLVKFTRMSDRMRLINRLHTAH